VCVCVRGGGGEGGGGGGRGGGGGGGGGGECAKECKYDSLVVAFPESRKHLPSLAQPASHMGMLCYIFLSRRGSPIFTFGSWSRLI
jgi:hypothetical protein